MAEKTWYASRNDEQIGPIALEALQQMAVEQELTMEDLVWEAGTPGWVPAGQIPSLCAAAGWGDPRTPSLPAPPRASFQEQYQPQIQSIRNRVGELDRTEGALEALPHLRFIHRRLEDLHQLLTTYQLDEADRLLKRVGTLSYMLAAVLYGGFFAVTSLRADSIRQFLLTLLIVIPGASLCHYIAVHFIDSSEEMLGRTPTELASKTLPTTLGLFMGVFGLVMLVFIGYDVFRQVDVVEAMVLAPIALILLYAAAVCFNPSSMNTGLGSRSGAAREAIGISMFLAKLPLRLVPVVFALSALLASVSAGYFCYHLFKGADHFELALLVARRALSVGLLPMALYLISLFVILLVDVFRASLDMSDGVQELASVLDPSGKNG